VTGGNLVDVGCDGGGNLASFTLDYIYAPNALVRFNYDSTFIGSYIGNSIKIDSANTEIRGDPYGEIAKPIIPQPNLSNDSEGDGDGDWLVNINIDSNGFTPVFAFPNNNNEASGLPQSVDFTKDYTFDFIFTMVDDTTLEVIYSFDDGDTSTTINLGQWTLLLDDEEKPGQKKPKDMYKSIFHSNAEQGHGSHAIRGLYFEYDEDFNLDTLTVDNDMDATHDPDLRAYVEGFSNNSNGDVINRNKVEVYETEKDNGKGNK